MLPEGLDQRHAMLAHELFHRIQPTLPIAYPQGDDNGHLDTLEGRYLLQLEWRALAAALKAPDPAARRTAVSDALLFRAERYGLFADAAKNEGALEANEGIAQYTGVRLGLALRHDLERPLLVPAWLFDTQGGGTPMSVVAVDPRWLKPPATTVPLQRSPQTVPASPVTASPAPANSAPPNSAGPATKPS